MKFTILGSGGAIRIPKACCTCTVCIEARQKGFPYKRLGQSLFMHDEQILFDTPEDINEELNCHNIDDISCIFYSHWHPDHILGCRIVETLMDDSKELKSPIDVHMPREGIDLSINGNSVLNYYNSIGYINVINSDEDVYINQVRIKKIKLNNGFSYSFLITNGDKKVFYCPCHSMDIPYLNELYDVDLMIMCKGYSSIQNDEWTNFERDTLRVINELTPKKVLITHIEETDGIGYDSYKELEKKYNNIEFAYDGQVVEI